MYQVWAYHWRSNSERYVGLADTAEEAERRYGHQCPNGYRLIAEGAS